MCMGINFALGKDECDAPSGLGDRSIIVVIQWGGWVGWRWAKYLQFTIFLKFDNFNFKACSGC